MLLLKLAQLKDDGSTSITPMELWQVTGSVLIKPPLLTIAMIFAWIYDQTAEGMVKTDSINSEWIGNTYRVVLLAYIVFRS